jgi:ferric-dicitrate binding protein FerR (iron transport regulator)
VDSFSDPTPIANGTAFSVINTADLCEVVTRDGQSEVTDNCESDRQSTGVIMNDGRRLRDKRIGRFKAWNGSASAWAVEQWSERDLTLRLVTYSTETIVAIHLKRPN